MAKGTTGKNKAGKEKTKPPVNTTPTVDTTPPVDTNDDDETELLMSVTRLINRRSRMHR